MIYLMPIYILIVLVIVIRIIKSRPWKSKWLQLFVLAFLFYLPVGWDVILGRIYFNYMCSQDGGVHIYKTIKLDQDNWSKDGEPKFYTEKGDFNEEYFNGRYIYYSAIKDTEFDDYFSVSRRIIYIYDTREKENLGEIVSYLYGGGWVVNAYQPFNVSSQRCPILIDYKKSDLPDNPDAEGKGTRWYRKFDSYIFINNKES